MFIQTKRMKYINMLENIDIKINNQMLSIISDIPGNSEFVDKLIDVLKEIKINKDEEALSVLKVNFQV